MKAREGSGGWKDNHELELFTNTMLASESITTKALNFNKLMPENHMAKIKCIKTFPSQRIIVCVPLPKEDPLFVTADASLVHDTFFFCRRCRQKADGWSMDGQFA